jgi:hypothetical protein
MDGEGFSEISAHIPGEGADELGENLAGSGWTSTKQAAKVLGVSRRSVQGYVRRGILEAREEGEGVNKRFFVSIDSLNALRDKRSGEALAADNFADASSDLEEAANLAANAGEGLRHVVDRLEARTVEATELRVRLEITERAESTLREELAEERRRREEAERRAEDLERLLRERQEAPQEPAEVPEGSEPRHATGGAREAAEPPERRSWWRRVFGG